MIRFPHQTWLWLGGTVNGCNAEFAYWRLRGVGAFGVGDQLVTSAVENG
jgi:hypothetical protein